jgi:ABC-type arginine transport system permease subunit
MNKFLGGVIGLSLVVSMAACAGASVVATPTPTPRANVEACQTFGVVTKKFKDERTDLAGDKLIAEFDRAALSATGDVKSRIETLIRNLPDPILLIYIDLGFTGKLTDAYDADVRSVVRACSADKNAVIPETFDYIP